jgi:hypothetical protein
MKRFDPVPVPRGWKTHALVKGKRWLRDHPHAERPRDLWSDFQPQLAATELVPPEQADIVQSVLRWLCADERVVRQRAEWFRMYREGELTLGGLAKKAPLIAASLRRQPEFLREADREDRPEMVIQTRE